MAKWHLGELIRRQFAAQMTMEKHVDELWAQQKGNFDEVIRMLMSAHERELALLQARPMSTASHKVIRYACHTIRRNFRLNGVIQ